MLQTVLCVIMTYNVKSHYDIQGDSQCFSEKNQTQAICNCRIIAVIWSRSYFSNVSIFLLMALGGIPENPGINHF